jgi:hypothetical protein
LHKLNNDQLSKKYFVVCNILGSHGGAAEDSSPLVCDAVSLREDLATFRKSTRLYTSRSSSTRRSGVLPLRIKGLQSFETSGITDPKTRPHIPVTIHYLICQVVAIGNAALNVDELSGL